MSPRAAWRLETLGFQHVFDYVAGKADWGAAGLPLEGTLASKPSAADVADRDVPTCSLHEELAAVRARVRETTWDTCIVINEKRVVLGRLGRGAISSDEPSTVEEAMTDGPSTSRPSLPANTLLEQMTGKNLRTALITSSDGTLVGLARRENIQRTLSG